MSWKGEHKETNTTQMLLWLDLLGFFRITLQHAEKQDLAFINECSE